MHRPPRLTRPVARQLDRLARRAHAFHRFAHHPLCNRYASEVIRLRGRTRICRGCTYALAGTLGGFAVGAVLPITAVVASALAGLSLTVAAMSVSRQQRARSGVTRRSKLSTRAAPFAGVACAFAWCVRVHDGHALALGLGILGLALGLLALYRGAGPDRSPCLDCPERSQVVLCSGFRDIVRAERAFVRRSHALLDP